MYVNFYGNKIEYAISVPVLVYKISAYIRNYNFENTDILGDTIIKLIKENEKLDINHITRMIGIPNKYKKLVEYEINELLDSNKIKVNSDNVIIDKNVSVKEKREFFVIYDKENNVFLSCIIPYKDFMMYYLVKDNFPKDKSYILEQKKEIKSIDKYNICYKIQDLISKSNKLCNVDLYENVEKLKEEDFISIRPHKKISLDIVENIESPIKADFLIKAYINKNQNIEIEDPFTRENESSYIDKHILNRVDEDKLYKLLNNNNEFIQIDLCSQKSIEYLSRYEKLDKNQERLKHIERISLYKELLNLNSDVYKNFSLATIEIEKIVKSLLKEITENFKLSELSLSNVKIKSFCEMSEFENIKDIFIINTIISQNHKSIKQNKKIIHSIGENSISSYLKCIFLSKYLIKNNNLYEKQVFNLFSKDKRLINFLNDIWLYRNNTSHNIEKYKYYNSDYDMDIMHKDRLYEVTRDLMIELIYFLETIKTLD